MDITFQKMKAENFKHLSTYYGKRHDNTCDSVLLDSFLWADYYHVHFCERDEKAILWIMQVMGKQFAALPVCACEYLPHYFKELEQYFNENLKLPLEIYLADEEAVKYLNLPAERYQVTELDDAKDYLYSADALKTLSGKALHKKKNNLNAFKKAYDGRYEYRKLDGNSGGEIWKFLDKWREEKGQEVEGHLDYEVEGIHNILRNYALLNVCMGGIYVDGALEAFSIGTYNPTEKMAIIHIEKANPQMRGLYQLINQEFLIHEFPEAEIVNREDDLGIPGLRQAKMSYAPMGFARKYRIRQLDYEENGGMKV